MYDDIVNLLLLAQERQFQSFEVPGIHRGPRQMIYSRQNLLGLWNAHIALKHDMKLSCRKYSL